MIIEIKIIKVDYELLKCNCQFGHTKYDTNNQKIFSIGDALKYTYSEEFFIELLNTSYVLPWSKGENVNALSI